MKQITILLSMLFITALSYGQNVIFEEDFNADTQPANWWNSAGIDNVRLTTITPINDTCATAEQVDINSVTSGTSVNATGTGESGCGLSSNNVGVWYYFNIGGPSSIDVWIENASFDAKLTILGGCSASSCIANDDDSGVGNSPRVQFTPGGSPVYIYVVGYDTATGTFDLHVAYSIENDECVGAENLDVQYNVADYAASTPLTSTIRAATDSGLPAEECEGYTDGTANDDVWFSFTPNTENVSIAIDDDFDGVINLFEGNCGGLTMIDCADAGPIPQIDATGLTVGQEYFVRVYNYSSNTTLTPNFDISVWSEGSGVGIAEAVIDGFSMYPNPVESVLNLSAQNTIDTVSIYNLLGQEVLNATPSATQTQVDMSNLPTGAYVVKVQAGEQVGAYNLIKE